MKIGKTSRNPTLRAQELSSATGVPAPFMLVYEARFADCDRAEQFVHTYLERGGHRLTANREFFRVAPTEAIRAVMCAEAELGTVAAEQSRVEDEFDDPLLAELRLELEPSEPIWRSLLDEADEYRFGHGDTIEDPEMALQLYEQAARLGAPEAFVNLAEMHAAGDGCAPSSRRALDWLKRGAKQGVVECWAVLAEVFTGKNVYFDLAPHEENARKCWRRFFNSVDPIAYGTEGAALFGRVRTYVGLLSHLRADEYDRLALERFEKRFVAMLSATNAPEERDAKIAQLRQVLGR